MSFARGLVLRDAAVVFEVYQDVRIGQITPDPLLQTVGDLVRVPERSLRPALQTEIDVPLRAALACPKLVEATDTRVAPDFAFDHTLYQLELSGRQALVQKDAGASRDQTERRQQ